MVSKKCLHPLQANQKLNNEDLEEEFPHVKALLDSQFQRPLVSLATETNSAFIPVTVNPCNLKYIFNSSTVILLTISYSITVNFYK